MLLFFQIADDRKKFLHFLPLAGISFFIAFNYYIVRALKDTLLVTAENAGAEAIPFVKVWLLLPTSLLLAMGFAWLSSRFSIRVAFTVIISFFLFSFSFFTFVLFPLRDLLHPHAFALRLMGSLPEGWHALAAIIDNWTYAYFYVMAENWSPIVYSVLFWGFANEITKIHDARRYYPLLTLAGTTAALVAGPVAIYLSRNHFNPAFPLGNTPWEQTLYALTFVVLACGFCAILLFWQVCPRDTTIKTPKSKPKLSFFQSLHYLANSRYLIMIAIIGLSYNMMMNLSEVVWKNEVLKLYPNPSEFNQFTSYITLAIGIISTIITLFITRPALKYLGWTKTALIAPIAVLITGTLFFSSIISNIVLVPMAISTVIGSCHMCLCCSGKYTLFDTTKELAFIPLDSQEKLSGKAAIDGVGSRVGKAGSSLFIQTLLIALPSISACTPFIAVLLFFALVICIKAVMNLGVQMEQRTETA